MLVLKTNVIYYLLFNEAKYFLSKKLKKKLSFSFYSLHTFSLYISHNFLLLSTFLSLFYLLSLTQLFKTAMSSISLTWTSPLVFYTQWPNGLPLISSSFPSFLPPTCFTSNHNKWKHTSLDLCT